MEVREGVNLSPHAVLLPQPPLPVLPVLPVLQVANVLQITALMVNVSPFPGAVVEEEVVLPVLHAAPIASVHQGIATVVGGFVSRFFYAPPQLPPQLQLLVLPVLHVLEIASVPQGTATIV